MMAAAQGQGHALSQCDMQQPRPAGLQPCLGQAAAQQLAGRVVARVQQGRSHRHRPRLAWPRGRVRRRLHSPSPQLLVWPQGTASAAATLPGAQPCRKPTGITAPGINSWHHRTARYATPTLHAAPPYKAACETLTLDLADEYVSCTALHVGPAPALLEGLRGVGHTAGLVAGGVVGLHHALCPAPVDVRDA
jgi:hypothetical protein